MSREGPHIVAAVLNRLSEEWDDGPPERWHAHTVPEYLEALSAWLSDCEAFYAHRGRPVPADAWEVVADAVQAAAAYE